MISRAATKRTDDSEMPDNKTSKLPEGETEVKSVFRVLA